jgi:hypothetical protein
VTGTVARLSGPSGDRVVRILDGDTVAFLPLQPGLGGGKLWIPPPDSRRTSVSERLSQEPVLSNNAGFAPGRADDKLPTPSIDSEKLIELKPLNVMGGECGPRLFIGSEMGPANADANVDRDCLVAASSNRLPLQTEPWKLSEKEGIMDGFTSSMTLSREIKPDGEKNCPQQLEKPRWQKCFHVAQLLTVGWIFVRSPARNRG